MFSIEFDRKLGIVRCTTDGFYSPGDVREHSKIAQNIVKQARIETGRLRSLVVKIDGQVQTPETMEAASLEKSDNQPGDRVAIVVRSALGRIQLSRFAANHEKVFGNEEDALEWLLER